MTGTSINQLAVFDVDGTLTDTCLVDEVCFQAAMKSALGIVDPDPDWYAYTDYTDAGIISDAFLQAHGRPPAESEIQAFIGEFVLLLEKAYSDDPQQFSPVNGAGPLLNALRDAESWSVAIATGCWEASALLKLRYAGLQVDEIPFASSDDFRSREEIVQTAISRSIERSGVPSYHRIVLIGDTIRDVRTARILDYPFLGIGTGRKADELRREGASNVLPDYTDITSVIHHLGSASVPGPE